MPRSLTTINQEERELIYQEMLTSQEPRRQIAKKYDISLSGLNNLRNRHIKKQKEPSSTNFIEVKTSCSIEQSSSLSGLQAANFAFKEYSIELRGKFPHKILLDILQISSED